MIEVRLRPTTPWRVGHHAGDRERVDVVYRSDALYSAVTHAMRSLGWLEEWLDVTARAPEGSRVRFSSLFPFLGKTRLIAPPRSAWPPANPGKLYLESTRLVPLEIARGGVIDESRWSVDGASESLIPSGASAPFQVSVRSAAAVDRLTGALEPHRMACVEFAPNAGWWGLFEADDPIWEGRVKSAFRLLADSGFGGERSRGWGRSREPEFFPASALFQGTESDGSWWLLSLYSPGPNDQVDWTRGQYSAVTRGGWTDSPVASGEKKQARMIEEGSVLWAPSLRGRAVDVAPDGFAHPVYRSGFAFAVPVPKPTEAVVVAEAPEELPVPDEALVAPDEPAMSEPAPQEAQQPSQELAEPSEQTSEAPQETPEAPSESPQHTSEPLEQASETAEQSTEAHLPSPEAEASPETPNDPQQSAEAPQAKSPTPETESAHKPEPEVAE